MNRTWIQFVPNPNGLYPNSMFDPPQADKCLFASDELDVHSFSMEIEKSYFLPTPSTNRRSGRGPVLPAGSGVANT